MMRLTTLPPSFRRTMGAALLALAGLGLVAVAAPAQETEEEGPLHAAMEEMQSGLRSLRKLIGSAETTAQAVDLVRAMQGHALTAFGHPPAPPESNAGDAAKLWSVEFRQGIHGLLGELLSLEHLLVEGKLEEAKASYATLTKIKKEAHDRFQVD